MNNLPLVKDPIIKKDSAIKAAGSASKLARSLNVARASVSAWGEVVPPLQAYRLLQIFPFLENDQQ